MIKDYSPEINKFWPTIMLAWKEHADKRPVFDRVVNKVGIMVFIRDNKNRILQSYTFPSSELEQEEIMI